MCTSAARICRLVRGPVGTGGRELRESVGNLLLLRTLVGHWWLWRCLVGFVTALLGHLELLSFGLRRFTVRRSAGRFSRLLLHGRFGPIGRGRGVGLANDHV